MFVMRPGSTGPLVVLNDAMERITNEQIEAHAKRLAEHEKNGVPTDELGEPPEPYERTEETDAVRIRIRALTQLETFDLIRGLEGDASEIYVGMRKLVARAVADFHGLEDEDGPIAIKSDEELTEAQLDAIDAAGLMNEAWSVARYFQHLTGAEKKLFGLPPQST